MKTITAKELRDNLGTIMNRVEAGEHIYVSYRNRLSVKLEPAIIDNPMTKKPLAGLRALQQAQKKIQIPSRYSTGNLKQLYHEDMAKKYGIKP